MDKLENLNMYIKILNEILTGEKDWNTYAHKEVRKIYSLYKTEIPDIKEIFSSLQEEGEEIYANKSEIEVLAAKLEHYASTLEEQHKRDALQTSKFSQPINAHIYNSPNIETNINPTISSNTNVTNTIEISYQQTIQNILDLDEDILSNDDRVELLGYINALEKAKKNKDKNTLLEKVGGVMKFIVDKGVQVGIAVLPHLGEVSKFIKSL